jgi:hypothetical protein
MNQIKVKKSRRLTPTQKVYLGIAMIALGGLLIGGAGSYLITRMALGSSILRDMKNSGYILTTDATATEDDIVQGKTAYVNGELINGSHYVLDTSDATATGNDIRQGKTAFVDGEAVVGTITAQVGGDVYPGVTSITIPGGVYLSSDLTLHLGDKNLIPENIKKGVTVFYTYGLYDGIGE